MASTTVTTNTIKKSITDDQIADLRKKIGVVERPSYKDWQLEDSRILRSTIRTWAVLNGDMRPLYMDPDYAAESPWGAIIAPPAMILSYEQIDPEIDAIGGAFSVLRSARLEFDNPIRMGDIILSESEITDVKEVTDSNVEGRVISTSIETRVSTQEGQAIGRAMLDWHLYERGSSAQHSLFGTRKDGYEYSREDIEALGQEYKLEQQRGSTPLYWDDVNEGDALQCVLKGPTTRPKYIARRNHIWYWGMRQGFEEMEQHPERFFVNENNALEPVMATDWVHHRAQRWGGLPGALEVNTDRAHHLAQTLANWMGDAGYPVYMDLQFPVQNMVGDVTRSYGRVTGKRQENGRSLVQLDLWQENQLKENITSGSAEVVLPSR